MNALVLLLLIKIGITAALVAAPLLLAPAGRLLAPDGATTDVTVFRLYGVAILALLTVYASGALEAAGGRFPWGAVAAGLVSNGGATGVLALTGAWRRRPRMTLFFAAVTFGLAAAALLPQAALHRLA